MSQKSKAAACVDAVDDDRSMDVDIQTVLFLKSRLSLHEFGCLTTQIARAAGAKRPSELQRLLLAIVRHRDAPQPAAESDPATTGAVA